MSGLEQFFLEGALNWQNVALAIGGILFTVALIPVLRNKMASVPWTAALLTAGVLTAYIAVYASLGLWFAVIAGIGTAAAWWLILVFRRVKA